jgi:hypothetical protein
MLQLGKNLCFSFRLKTKPTRMRIVFVIVDRFAPAKPFSSKALELKSTLYFPFGHQ